MSEYYPPLYVVAGPPASGKSTYVAQHLTPGDLLIDTDRLAVALTGTTSHPLVTHGHTTAVVPFLLEARDAILARLRRPSTINRAWLVIGGANRQSRRRPVPFLRPARVIVLETPTTVCLARVRQARDRPGGEAVWRPIIEAWWQAYERDDRDERLTVGTASVCETGVGGCGL